MLFLLCTYYLSLLLSASAAASELRVCCGVSGRTPAPKSSARFRELLEARGSSATGRGGSVWPEPQTRRVASKSLSWSSFFAGSEHHQQQLTLAFAPGVCLYTASAMPRVIFWFHHFCEHVPIHHRGDNTRAIKTVHATALRRGTLLRLGHDESYEIQYRAPTTTISATEVWGIRHALETLLQINDIGTPLNTAQVISDAPAFPWRGLLLDTSRHFLPESSILHQLEAMAMSKLNVFHWHLTDAQSFPFLLTSRPELATVGAHKPGMWYDAATIRRVVQFAEKMGVRVVPEIDVPSHTWSWRAAGGSGGGGGGEELGGLPSSIVLECSHLASPKVADRFKRQDKSTLDPTNPKTFEVISDVLDEIVELFPDKYVHLGGDEVDLRCFTSSPKVMARAKQHLGIQSPHALLQYFWDKVIGMVVKRDRIPMVWEGVFGQQIRMPKAVVLQAWRNWGDPALGLLTGQRAARAGLTVLQSTHYYLDWNMRYSDYYEKEYYLDPTGTIGGEGCSWSENVDALNVDCRVWPRAAVMAERLWKGARARGDDDAYAGSGRRHAYETHRDRMVARGLVAAADGGLHKEYCGQIEQALQRKWSGISSTEERLGAYHLVVRSGEETLQDKAFLWIGRKTDAALVAVLVKGFSTVGLRQQDKFIERLGKHTGLPYTKVCLYRATSGRTLIVAGRSPVQCAKQPARGVLPVRSGGVEVRVLARTGMLLSAGSKGGFVQSGRATATLS